MPNPTVAAAAAGLPQDTSSRLGQLYGDLEGAIGDVSSAVAVLSVVASSTIETIEPLVQKAWADACPGMKSYRVYALTDEQANALDYAWRHVRDVTRQLHDAYHGGFEIAAGDEGRAKA